MRATYRLQLGPDLSFDDARELVPYLRDLGVSHLYLSPSLQAPRGSAHGYDVTDPRWALHSEGRSGNPWGRRASLVRPSRRAQRIGPWVGGDTIPR